MRLRTSILASSFLAAACVLGSDARAQSTATATFDAVSSYAVNGETLKVTGVQHGASAPSTFSVINNGATPSIAWQACQQQVLVMINRPGRFSLGIAYVGGGVVSSCSLTQLP